MLVGYVLISTELLPLERLAEYGFSTRLAKENFWTKDFTEQAILEYKKFMYLAGTAGFMVSPSHIVDLVWHQHLIFTKSYAKFCTIIGKDIQHIPSTHNKEEYATFKQAKDQTTEQYLAVFGEQPEAIWAHENMFDSLKLKKARINIRTFMLLGILAFIGLTIPLYHVLRPVYLEIGNPGFLIGYIVLVLITFLGLEIINKNYLRGIIHNQNEDTFIHHLRPSELIYLKTQTLSEVVQCTVNQMVQEEKLKVDSGSILEKEEDVEVESLEERAILDGFGDSHWSHYPMLLKAMVEKPVFENVANCMDAFNKFVLKSSAFGKLFYVNFGIISMVLTFGFLRMVTGFLRDKPIGILLFILFLVGFVMFGFLSRLTKQVSTQTIPKLYQDEHIPMSNMVNESQWDYFRYGTTALATTFLPMTIYADNSGSNFDGGGNSCASSCGSSCGSGCGGGCGGCGG